MPTEIIHWLIDTGNEIKIARGIKEEGAIVVFSKHRATCEDCLKH